MTSRNDRMPDTYASTKPITSGIHPTNTMAQTMRPRIVRIFTTDSGLYCVIVRTGRTKSPALRARRFKEREELARSVSGAREVIRRPPLRLEMNNA